MTPGGGRNSPARCSCLLLLLPNCAEAEAALSSVIMEGMTAVPADDCDPDDPVEILAVLPARYHQQFQADYEAALTGARRPEEYRRLRHVLRLWRLRAVAYSDPSFEDRLEAARSGTGTRIPAEQIPGWNVRMAAERRRRGQA
jgi:hypothetical protein